MNWWPGTTCVLALGLAAAAAARAASPQLNPLHLAPDHATASVADLDRMASWYERALGFREVGRNTRDGFEVRHLAVPGYRIDLAWEKGSSRQHERSGYQEQGWMHVVFKVPAAALEEDLRRLTTLDTDARGDRDPKGAMYRIYLHDPEGNELEIVSEALSAEMNACLTKPAGCAPPK